MSTSSTPREGAFGFVRLGLAVGFFFGLPLWLMFAATVAQTQFSWVEVMEGAGRVPGVMTLDPLTGQESITPVSAGYVLLVSLGTATAWLSGLVFLVGALVSVFRDLDFVFGRLTRLVRPGSRDTEPVELDVSIDELSVHTGAETTVSEEEWAPGRRDLEQALYEHLGEPEARIDADSAPLSRVLVFREDEHLCLVGEGLSELFEKVSDDVSSSGLGFELTLAWDDVGSGLGALEALAHLLDSREQRLTDGGMVPLPESLGPFTWAWVRPFEAISELETENGTLRLWRLIPITDEERRAAMSWRPDELLGRIEEPWRPQRPLLTEDPEIMALVEEKTRLEGSSVGEIQVSHVAIAPGPTLEIGVGDVDALQVLIPGRLRHARALRLDGPRMSVTLKDGPSLHHSEATQTLVLPPAAVKAVPTLAGEPGTRAAGPLMVRVLGADEPAAPQEESGSSTQEAPPEVEAGLLEWVNYAQLALYVVGALYVSLGVVIGGILVRLIQVAAAEQPVLMGSSAVVLFVVGGLAFLEAWWLGQGRRQARFLGMLLAAHLVLSPLFPFGMVLMYALTRQDVQDALR